MIFYSPEESEISTYINQTLHIYSYLYYEGIYLVYIILYS